ncbi:unnamed protein product, partial [Notodromas monacha]
MWQTQQVDRGAGVRPSTRIRVSARGGCEAVPKNTMGVTKSQRVAPSLVVDPVGGDGAAVALELGAVKQEPVWSSSEAAADADEDGQLKKRSHCLACCSVRGLLEFLVVLAGLLFIALKNKGDIAIQPWGFYCSDASLQKVENGDTISPLMLLSVSILAPIILVVVNEFMVESATNGFSWRRGFRRSRGPTAVFFLAIFYTAVSTDVLKFYMSMPRPHFFQTCKPKFDEDDCLANRFITEFTCTASGSKSRIIDSQQSFPSGHASISAAAATAVIAYTVERIVCKWRQHGGLHAVRRSDGSPALGIMGINRMVPGVICVCSFVWAMVCGLSRVKDHRHHWWDVLVGAIIGVLVALIS